MISVPQGTGRICIRVVTFWVLALAGLFPAISREKPGPFRVESLAEGVLLFRPMSSEGARANSLVIEGEKHLVVVDAQPSPVAARELLEAIEKTSSKPIRYLIYSHAHADSVGGASAFPPSTIRIASENCHESLKDSEYDVGAETRERASPGNWVEPERVLPDLVIASRITIPGKNPVILLPLPHSHTPGDLLVHLPEAKLVAVGHLASGEENPYGRDAVLSGWTGTLNNILLLTPSKIVPLNGPVMDARELRIYRDSLAWLRGKISLAFVDLVPPEKIFDWIRGQSDFSSFFKPDADPDFLSYLVDHGIQEEIVHRRKRGIPSPGG